MGSVFVYNGIYFGTMAPQRKRLLLSKNLLEMKVSLIGTDCAVVASLLRKVSIFGTFYFFNSYIGSFLFLCFLVYEKDQRKNRKGA